MRKVIIILLPVFLVVWILLYEYYDNDTQNIAGAVAQAGRMVTGAHIAIVEGNNSCDDPIVLARSTNGWFLSQRTVADSFFRKYPESLRLCINIGNGWKEAWEGTYSRTPGLLQFACFDIESNENWVCMHNCSDCNNRQLRTDFERLHPEVIQHQESVKNLDLKYLQVEIKDPR